MRNILIISVLLTVVFFSCKNGNESGSNVDQDKIPVVSVKGQTLYKGELNKLIPWGLPEKDSIAAAKAYITMWINDQLMYNKAIQNIQNKDQIDQLVEDYKKSLTTNSYQEQLLRDNFAKTVSDKTLQNYFEQNKERFKLNESIIKGLYLKVPRDSKELENFRKWYKQTTDVAIGNIEKNTLQNVTGYEYFYDKWLSFDEMAENMPLTVGNAEQYLRGNKSIEVQDTAFVYLLNIKEYKLAGNEAPFEYIKHQLAEAYIEQQRAEYLKQLQQDLYNKAVSDEEIKFYDK